MRLSHLVICTILVTLAYSIAPTSAVADQTATEKSQEEQYLSLATTRTKAELACRKATEVLDESRSGWDDISRTIEQYHTRAVAIYQKALQAEQSKAEADRIQATIDELNNQLQQLEQDSADGAAQRDKLAAAYRDAGVKAQNAYQVFQNLTGLEGAWKNAGMDLSVLNSNYDLVTKTVGDAIAQGQKAIDDLKDLQSQWETKIAAASKTTGIKP